MSNGETVPFQELIVSRIEREIKVKPITTSRQIALQSKTRLDSLRAGKQAWRCEFLTFGVSFDLSILGEVRTLACVTYSSLS